MAKPSAKIRKAVAGFKKRVASQVKKAKKPAAYGKKGACKPTLKLKGTTGARYKEMCSIYAETRKAYHALGRKAMGTSEKSPARKLYEQTKKDYKKIGKALFKMGHPKSEWNSQHKR
jgi:hypothetical protein